MVSIGQIGGMLPVLSNMTPIKPARAVSDPDVVKNAVAVVERMKAEPDSAMTGQFLATKAHSVIRKDGQIVAVQWRDGTTEVRKPIGQPWDKEKVIQQGLSAGLSKEQLNDLYVRDLAKSFGGGVSIDRYTGRNDAPTRGELMQSPLSGQALGRRLSVSA